MPPSPRRSGRSTGTARTMAREMRRRRVLAGVLEHARGPDQQRPGSRRAPPGARDGVPPSASTSASASCAERRDAQPVPACGSTTPAPDQPRQRAQLRQARLGLRPGARRGSAAAPPAPRQNRSAAVRSRPSVSSAAWTAQRLARRPASSGCQPGPPPAPKRRIQSSTQACAERARRRGCRARRGRRARGRPGAPPPAAGRAAAPSQIEPPPSASSWPSARQRPATSASPRSASPTSTGSGSARGHLRPACRAGRGAPGAGCASARGGRARSARRAP